MRDAVKHGVAPPPARYGAGAVTFHWTVAALIVFLGGLGLLFDDIPSAARPFWINVHVCVGLIYFALVIARVLWRTTHKAPDLGADIGEFSRRTSFAVHHLLYVLMLLIPVVGVVARVWHGRGFDYGVFQLDFGAASDPAVFHPAEKIHQLLAYALFALAGLHAAGALYHQFVRRDGILLRMMPGGSAKMRRAWPRGDCGPGSARPSTSSSTSVAVKRAAQPCSVAPIDDRYLRIPAARPIRGPAPPDS